MGAGSSTSCLTSNQHPGNARGKAAEHSSDARPVAHLEDQDGSRLQTGPLPSLRSCGE